MVSPSTCISKSVVYSIKIDTRRLIEDDTGLSKNVKEKPKTWWLPR